MSDLDSSAEAGSGTISKSKRRVFRAFTALLLLAIGFFAAEFGLRWRHASIQSSDRLDPGLIVRDSTLGWRTAPLWSGEHHHHDFSAAYGVTLEGGRKDPAFAGWIGGKVTVVLGDSFTFGLGVGDEETFVHRLNVAKTGGRSFANEAIPGYSTDQQALLLEGLLKARRPASVLLVVYLANDLLDNQLDFPLQINQGKPRFELEGDSLVLKNSPVPEARKGPAEARRTLLSAVLGEDALRGDFWLNMESRWALARTLRQAAGSPSAWGPEREARLAPAVKLFWAIVERMRGQCEKSGVAFSMALLAGRSFVEEPRSLSARYQEFFRREIATVAESSQIPLIDIASEMRTRFQKNRSRWFFPHDGHLTARGHEVVAEVLAPRLAELGEAGGANAAVLREP